MRDFMRSPMLESKAEAIEAVRPYKHATVDTGVLCLNDPQIENTVEMLMWRMEAYKHAVLKGTGVALPTIQQLLNMNSFLRRNKRMEISIGELVISGVYTYYIRRKPALFTIFTDLYDKGLLSRTRRPAGGRLNKGKTVICWGLTDRGRELLREYYEWIMGKHDDVVSGWMEKRGK